MDVDILLKILLSALLGGIVGMERELSRKEAGLRTNILIAMGSTLITIISIKFADFSQSADPGRLAAQIITGIGFIGAGAIIQARFAVHGLTTAATVWIVAAIGITVGSGYYLLAFLITIFVVVILYSFRYLVFLFEKQRVYAYLISTEERATILLDVKKVIKEMKIQYTTLTLKKMADGYELEVVLTTSENKNREFVEKVLQLEGVEEINSENL